MTIKVKRATTMARQHPGITFVHPHDPSTPPKRKSNPKWLRRHVMLAHLSKCAGPAENKTCAQHLKDTQSITSTNGDDSKALELLLRPNSLARSPALPSSGPTYACGAMSMSETAVWFFCSHLREAQAHLFTAAHKTWVEQLWDAARYDALVLRCISLSMLLKRANLTGQAEWASYYKEKQSLLRDLKAAIGRLHKLGSQPQQSLALAMALLSELESRELGDLPAARIHLKAISNLFPNHRLSHAAWRVASRVDLRQSLVSGERPLMTYYIPEGYKKRLRNSTEFAAQATALSLENCRALPESRLLDNGRSFELLRNLHQICLPWDVMIADSEVPLGHVYDLAYRLRLLHADASANIATDNELVVKVVSLTLQLHSWIISRYWTVQVRNLHASTLKRALDPLPSNLLEIWLDQGGEYSSLLWVLFSFSAAKLDMDPSGKPNLLPILLAKTCQKLGINSIQEFEAKLKRWPWLDSWHGPRMELVWAEMNDPAEVPPLSAKASEILKAIQDPKHLEKRWFLGSQEFYSSL
ncbi:uncharacterized protein LTR77_008896 [Saxophila tyrrhenica]|uniref:Uncharacterized protein n=1 Tax=Saxophila tyrrhenica TaxID=1690608 RepID=A0AAV9P2W5_9PEZI|nr:hypothetical protein LTR77_008896 [Saxophila tyrrhenica]